MRSFVSYCMLILLGNDLIKKKLVEIKIDSEKPRPYFGGPSKRGRFGNSKASSDKRPTKQKRHKSNFSIESTPNYFQGKPRVPTCPQCGKNQFGTCRRAWCMF